MKPCMPQNKAPFASARSSSVVFFLAHRLVPLARANRLTSIYQLGRCMRCKQVALDRARQILAARQL